MPVRYGPSSRYGALYSHLARSYGSRVAVPKKKAAKKPKQARQTKKAKAAAGKRKAVPVKAVGGVASRSRSVAKRSRTPILAAADSALFSAPVAHPPAAGLYSRQMHPVTEGRTVRR